jgi:four helix bundle protein
MEKRLITSHKDLVVWQKAMELVTQVYTLTSTFPKSEIYGLTSQMCRCAVSIPSNIAEGRRRGTKKDFRNFLFNAYGSAAELETQLEICLRLQLVTDKEFRGVESLVVEVLKMLNVLIRKLNK